MRAYLETIFDYIFYVLASFFFIVVFIFLITTDNKMLKGSIFDYANIKSEDYDGTVYPIEYVPNPFLLTYEQRKQNYDNIDSKYFIKTPIYDSNIFGKNPENLKIGTKDYEQTITQRLIYTIPYMSTYNFDYKEYTGSHPGIDIIVPNGTPIKNIASGVVVDVETNTSTFGNYVLIRHDNVVLPNGQKGTIYSLYGHMKKAYVKPGDKVSKGFVIGVVGHSGIATTDHLHFQIDLDNAPFHPYWPFSANDMKKAGVNFFDAVNIGLGREDAVKYTINPLDFVNKGLGFEKPLDKPKENDNQNIQTNDVKIDTGIDTNIQENKPEDKPIDNYIIPPIKNPILPNSDEGLNLDDNSGISIRKDDVKLLKSDKDFMLLNNIEFAMLGNDDRLLKSSNTVDNGLSDTFEKLDTVDKNQVFKDIKNDYKYLNQLLYFKDKNIISGFEDNTFKPENNLSRSEALKIILLGFGLESTNSGVQNFGDIPKDSWQNGYINAGINAGIINSKNTNFYPNNVITRIEAIKMISVLSKIDLEYFSKIDYKINDVTNDKWFYPYTLFAVKNNLFQLDNGNFYPDKPITREELIYILYKVIKK